MKKRQRSSKKVWEVEKRRFRDDFEKRMMLFRYFVLGVIMYRAEVWSWKGRKELKRIQKKIYKTGS